MLHQAADHIRKNIDPRASVTLTFNVQKQLASELGMTVEDLLARKSGQAPNAEQAIAARALLNDSGLNRSFVQADYYRFARGPLRIANSRQLSDSSHSASSPSHNYHVELLYQRRTRRARSVFQRLALPTSVSISNGICSG